MKKLIFTLVFIFGGLAQAGVILSEAELSKLQDLQARGPYENHVELYHVEYEEVLDKNGDLEHYQVFAEARVSVKNSPRVIVLRPKSSATSSLKELMQIFCYNLDRPKLAKAKREVFDKDLSYSTSLARGLLGQPRLVSYARWQYQMALEFRCQ